MDSEVDESCISQAKRIGGRGAGRGGRMKEGGSVEWREGVTAQ